MRVPIKAAFDLAGKADVASGIKTPEQAASRANTYANIPIPMAVGALTGGASLPANALTQMATTAAMQEGGLEPKSPGQVVASGALPFGLAGIGRLVRGMGRGLTRAMPGRFRAAQDEAQEAAGKVTEGLKPAAATGELFKGARAAGPERIPATQLTAMLDDLDATIPATPTSGGLKTAREFMDTARASIQGDSIPLGELLRLRLDLGQSIGKGPQVAAIYKAVLGDLSQAGATGGPGADLAMRALEAARKERGSALMGELVEKASRGRSALTGDLPLLNVSQLSKEVQTHQDEILKLVGPKGMEQIEQFLVKYRSLPPVHAYTAWNSLMAGMGAGLGLGGFGAAGLAGVAAHELVKDAFAVGRNPQALNQFLIMMGEGTRAGLGPIAEAAVSRKK